MKFGDLLKQRRTARNWTQPEASQHIGIEQSYLSKLETGKSAPSEEVFDRLVNAYDLDPAALSDTLFPAELDRLRSITLVRKAILANTTRRQSASRIWLVAGIAALALGGGLLGLAQIGHGGTIQYFTYQSPGVEAHGAEITTMVDEELTWSTDTYRGPRYTESVPGGQRVWGLIGGYEAARVGPYRLALVPGVALVLAGLGSFFASWRWH